VDTKRSELPTNSPSSRTPADGAVGRRDGVLQKNAGRPQKQGKTSKMTPKLSSAHGEKIKQKKPLMIQLVAL